jgi:hypothetical protein
MLCIVQKPHQGTTPKKGCNLFRVAFLFILSEAEGFPQKKKRKKLL